MNPVLRLLSGQIKAQVQAAREVMQQLVNHEEAASALLTAARKLLPDDDEWQEWLIQECGIESQEARNLIGILENSEDQMVLMQHRFGFLKPLEGEEREEFLKNLDLQRE
jgi:hypothetical protein